VIQTFLMFLAPAHEPAECAHNLGQMPSMATRVRRTSQTPGKPALQSRIAHWLAVVGNAAGFVVFLTGLLLVLRLAELLLS